MENILLCIVPLLLVVLVAAKNGKSPPRVHLLWSLLVRSPTVASLSTLLRRLHAAHGPVITLWTGGSKSAIFIADHNLAHRTLVRMGAAFAHRPAPPSWLLWTDGGVNGHGINSAAFGGRWALLRRNLSAHLGGALYSSIDRMVRGLELATAAAWEGGDDGVVVPSEMIRHAVFCLFAALCFGVGVAEEEDVTLARLRGLHAEILSLVVELDAFHQMPVALQLTHYFPRWRKLLDAQKRHHAMVTALIDARRRRREEAVSGFDRAAEHPCYVDTLLKLGLGDNEMVSLCWEFMNAASKTTTTALEWIMARLVLHQDIQQKLWDDMVRRSAGGNCSDRPFVEAVVLEALRRHPPAHYLLAHTTDKDVAIDGYVIHKGSVVNYCVAEIGRDAKLWTHPDVFRPERFLEGGEGTGAVVPGLSCRSQEPTATMKMMPFGAGRRACPGAAVAVKVLQAFTEDLIRRFKWIPVVNGQGVEPAVNMAEKAGLVTEMWMPLRARLVRRHHEFSSDKQHSV